MQNVPHRTQQSLNGRWAAIIDHGNCGDYPWSGIYKDKKPVGKTDFVEYSFDGGVHLDVPGDYNTQLPELKYYESTVWYKRNIRATQTKKRTFVYFDAANYQTDVFLNSAKLGHHEGGFTPFQFEITDLLKQGDNSLIVRVNNKRYKDGVPALDYDWLNYGGITRDVRLIETPATFIEDYFIQLNPEKTSEIKGYIQLNGPDNKKQKIKIEIPDAKFSKEIYTDNNGLASIALPAKLRFWSPENPVIYDVQILTNTDTIHDQIGFRTIVTRGNEILLNGKSIFLKGINFHEEIASRQARAYSEADALQLLEAAKELGCNFIRTAHYAQNEYIVRLAEKMGFMIWEEIPVFQSINFENQATRDLIEQQMRETIRRDKNRCGIIIWSVANETSPSTMRTKTLSETAALCRAMDNTRLISATFNNMIYTGNQVIIEDSLINSLDVIGVNEYIGWYTSWPTDPAKVNWISKYNKPLIITEFGAEALYGNHGSDEIASLWTEEYMEKVYKDQIRMMQQIPFLRGCTPWILVDFRSPRRLHPLYQNGWNRKGLLSDKGYKKLAWYVMKDFYSK